MARGNFRVEQGIEILEANGTAGISILRGAGAPAGTSGPTDDANVGSLYLRTDGEGQLYRKSVDSSQASDWEIMADGSVYTALGISDDAEDMGTFSQDIISDNASVKTALQELETELFDTEGNADSLITLSGVAENATDLGTFPGTTIADNETVKGALEDLESALEAVSGGATETVAISAGTPTTVSTCLVDDCNGIEWEVVVYETSDETKKEYFKHTSLHDGTTSADASSFDETTHTKLKVGDISGLSFTAKLAGTGASQTIGLEISATAAITVEVRRTQIP